MMQRSIHRFSTREGVLLCVLFLLSACSGNGVITDHGGDHGTMAGGSTLTIHDESTDGSIAYAIMDGDTVFSDYGITHTKEMHLIVVRDDLTQFAHLHPKRDAAGVWRIDHVPNAGGSYWIFADFAESGGKGHTLRFDRKYSGDNGAENFALHPGSEKVVDGYRVTLSTTQSADYVEFAYTMLDAAGAEPQLQDYLGEKGHSILLSRDGDFIHTHPHKEYVGYAPSDPPIFIVPRSSLKDDFYRVFTQFQIDGKVITADFDWLSPAS